MNKKPVRKKRNPFHIPKRLLPPEVEEAWYYGGQDASINILLNPNVSCPRQINIYLGERL